MIGTQIARFRVLDAHGVLITRGVTRENASLLEVLEAIQRLEQDPAKQQEPTSGGWTVERE